MSDGIVDVDCDSRSGGVSRSSSSDAEVRLASGLVEIANVTEQMSMRLESLQQENRVLRMELETFRCKCKGLEEENRELTMLR